MTPDLDIRLLRAFSAAAAWGSFAAGGPIAGCSPATASARVRVLEARLGATLFRRRGRPLRLTPAGRALLPRAEALLARHDRLLAERNMLIRGRAGPAPPTPCNRAPPLRGR